MERELLARWLEEGLSLQEIGRRVGKDASTVGWWVRKHGLRSPHASRHAPRGGLDREWLADRIRGGASIRSIAAAAGVSPTTVRHWLRRYSLQTKQSERIRQGRLARAEGHPTATMTCLRHGESRFAIEGRGTYRCLRCRSEAVAARRRRVKEILVQEAGGGCAICGYAGYMGALQFHHLEPEGKSFALSRQGVTRSIEDARAEASKCVLLCANCHAEVEAGVTAVPVEPPELSLPFRASGPR
jgi:transposase